MQGSAVWLQKITQAARLNLFLDYDGTLAEFAPTPDDILPDPQLIELLTGLRDHPDIQVSVISGRRLNHIRQLVPVPGILLSGTYGIEVLDPQGVQCDRLDYDQIRPPLESLKPHWAALIEDQHGFYLEDKGWSLAIHAKFADDQVAEDCLVRARKIVSGMEMPENLFRLLGGHKFLEIAPALADKGLAVSYLLETYPLADSLPVFFGDDDKDEAAITRIVDIGGAAVKVCAQPCQTTAQLQVQSPMEVRRFLKSLLDSRQNPR